MREITFKLSLEKTHISETLKVDKNKSDDEIEEMYIDWRNEQLHGGWSDGDNWTEV